MAHRNARLTFHGRRLLVERVVVEGQAGRPRRQGDGGLTPVRSSLGGPLRAEGVAGAARSQLTAPLDADRAPAPDVEAAVLAARLEHRRGQDWLGPELGVPARTVSRILRRHDVPRLCELDPLTGTVIRASKTTAVRYERARPGELVHMDVKKIGRIPDGGGWRAHGRQPSSTDASNAARIGYDYVHSARR